MLETTQLKNFKVNPTHFPFTTESGSKIGRCMLIPKSNSTT